MVKDSDRLWLDANGDMPSEAARRKPSKKVKRETRVQRTFVGISHSDSMGNVDVTDSRVAVLRK